MQEVSIDRALNHTQHIFQKQEIKSNDCTYSEFTSFTLKSATLLLFSLSAVKHRRKTFHIEGGGGVNDKSRI